MQKVVIVGAAVLGVVVLGVVLAGSRYEYLQRGGQSIRVHRITGRTEMLRPTSNGGVTWVAFRSPEEIDAEKQRCVSRELPSSALRRLVVQRVSDQFEVRNDSDWRVHVAHLRTAVPGKVFALRPQASANNTDPQVRRSIFSDLLERPGAFVPGATVRVPAFGSDVDYGTAEVAGAVGVPANCAGG